MVEEVRPWTAESGKGRVDVHGLEWFACDPYPHWYRWDRGSLIFPGYEGAEPDWPEEDQ
jgi:hypothetical protein